MQKLKIICTVWSLITLSVSAQSTLTSATDTTLAFKGAYGAGAYNKDWVGRNLYFVTNCDPSGAGSLQAAITSVNANGGVIIFNVACDNGIENSYNGMTIDQNGSGNGGFYIAGQTAPGKIIVTGGRWRAEETDNIVIRYISHRPNYSGDDAFELISCENVIVDHVSSSWGGDESYSTRAYAADPAQNITFQNMFVSSSKTGTLIGNSTDPSLAGNLSVHRNLYFNISHRVPNINADGRSDVINNLTWDWQARLTFVNGDSQLNHMNNYYGTGSRTAIGDARNKAQQTDAMVIYTDGNVVDKSLFLETDNDQDLWDEFNAGVGGTDLGPSYFTGTQYTPLLGNPVPVITADSTLALLPIEVGNSRYIADDFTIVKSWDTIDETYRQVVLSGEGSNINYENSPETFTSEAVYINFHALTHGTITASRPAGWDTDSDGLPDLWEEREYGDNDGIVEAGELDQTTWGDFDGDGWRNLEEYLALVDQEVVASVGYTVTPTSGLTTTEAGGTDTFDVVLDSQPTTDVVFDIISNDTSEGTVSSATLTFTNANWDTPQTITVTGQDDALDDGNIAYTVTVSVNDAGSDDAFDALSDVTINLINTDDEVSQPPPSTGKMIRARGGFIGTSAGLTRIKSN